MCVCQVNNNNTVSLLHYYNKGKHPSLLLSSNPTVGFTNIKTSYTNGVATCSFTRERKLSNIANYFDLNKSYYILTALGPIRSNGIGFHSFYQSSSSMFKL